MKNTARQKYKIHQGKIQSIKHKLTATTRETIFMLLSRNLVFACFAIIFHRCCGKSLHSWYETERRRHFWAKQVKSGRCANSTKNAPVLFCIVCNMNESRNIALACCPVPRLMCAQSTLGTPRHMEDNFGLDFLRRNFHISCFDFRQISSLAWFSGVVSSVQLRTHVPNQSLCIYGGTTLEQLLCGSFCGWI